jgi:hypothetical protein
MALNHQRRYDDSLPARYLKLEVWAPVIITVAMAGGTGALWAGSISTNVSGHEQRISKVENGMYSLGRGQSAIGTEIKNLKDEYQRQREADRVEDRRTQDALQQIFLHLTNDGE